jgi:hypothetical protein
MKLRVSRSANVDARIWIDLEFTLQVGALSDTVMVAESAPVVDTSKTVVSTTLDSSLLAAIPVGRRFSDALYLAPGVSSGGQVGSESVNWWRQAHNGSLGRIGAQRISSHECLPPADE